MAESQPDIQVFNQTDLSLPLSQSVYDSVASSLADHEKVSFSFVEVVYVDEDEIVRINQEHLDKDYVTDIITFRYDDPADNEGIEGTMFCCASRILEQAEEFDTSHDQEFLRVFIHGLLHLAGYEDKTDEEQKEMTDKENDYLSLAKSL